MTSSAPHPGDATLLAHLSQELRGERLEALLDHLASCEECVDRLLDLQALQPETPRAGVADFEIAAAWREMQRLLPEPEEALPPEPAPVRPPIFARTDVLRVAAFLLLAVALAFAAKTWQLQRQLRAMQVNVPVVYFDDDVRAAGPGAQIEAGEGIALIFLTPEEPRRFPSFSVELVDTEGIVRERRSGLLLSDQESLRIAIPRLAGRYSLRLFGAGAGEPVPLEQYSLEIK